MSYKIFVELPLMVTQNNRHTPLPGGGARLPWLNSKIITAINASYPLSRLPLQGNLFGLVYCFQKNNYKSDADNISKPLWDSLNRVLYGDDFQIKLRIAGIPHSPSGTIGIPANTLTTTDEILIRNFISNSPNDYLLYIEIGPLADQMFNYYNI